MKYFLMILVLISSSTVSAGNVYPPRITGKHLYSGYLYTFTMEYGSLSTMRAYKASVYMFCSGPFNNYNEMNKCIYNEMKDMLTPAAIEVNNKMRK